MIIYWLFINIYWNNLFYYTTAYSLEIRHIKTFEFQILKKKTHLIKSQGLDLYVTTVFKYDHEGTFISIRNGFPLSISVHVSL